MMTGQYVLHAKPSPPLHVHSMPNNTQHTKLAAAVIVAVAHSAGGAVLQATQQLISWHGVSGYALESASKDANFL